MKKLLTTGEIELSERAYKMLLISGIILIIGVCTLAMLTGDINRFNSLGY